MKICGFLQMYNEVEKGNLERCLKNMKQICDDIVIYDDGSTDNSVEVAKRYTNHIICGEKNDFLNELSHKRRLLKYAQEFIKPDWFLWLDADEVVDRKGTNGGIRLLCEQGITEVSNQLDQSRGYRMREVTLWRSQYLKRVDKNWDERWFVRLWKNTPKLVFPEKKGLHLPQYPDGIEPDIKNSNIEIIHFGYADYEAICRRYTERIRLGINEIDRDKINEDGIQLEAVTIIPYQLEPIKFCIGEQGLAKYRIKENYVNLDTDEFLNGHIYKSLMLANLNYINRNVLHIGCNSGGNTNIMNKLFIGVEGIDINPKAIERAKSLYPNIPFKVGNICDLPYSDGSFDGIYMLDILEHIYPEDVPVAINEIKRVLKKDGYVFIFVPRGDSRIFDPAHVQVFHKKEDIEIILGKYFEIVNCEYEIRGNPNGIGTHDSISVLCKNDNR